MGVAFLHPQDCLKNPLSKQPLISPPHMKNVRNPTLNGPNRAQQPKRRRRSPLRPNTTSPPPSRAMVAPKFPAKNLIMGQVKILKRGEELVNTAPDSPLKGEESIPMMPDLSKKGETPIVKKFGGFADLGSDLGSTDRLGPDPELMATQIRLTSNSNRVVGFYAGSACITSPPPSSLPLPAFFTKKCVSIKNNDATSDLIRMLRLDL
ncbi:hypothetical protein CFOL_v3_25637, partial [Cephalotus follicularis]